MTARRRPFEVSLIARETGEALDRGLAMRLDRLECDDAELGRPRT